MALFTILSFVIAFLGVFVYTYKNNELPESVSSMVYDLSDKKRWLWTAWICSIFGLLMPPMLERTDGSDWQFLCFLMTACFVFCGAYPLVNNEKNLAHYMLAYIGGIICFFVVISINAWFLLTWGIWVFYSFALMAWNKKPWVVWLECITLDKEVLLIEANMMLSLYLCVLFG